MTAVTEKELLAVERANLAIEESKAQPKKPLRKATMPIVVEWQDMSTGEDHSAVLEIRVLNFDEIHRVEVITSHLGSGRLNALSNDHAAFLRDLATIQVMWGDQLPKSLSERFQEDPELTAGVSQLIEAHRAVRFQRDGQAGKARTATVRLADAPASST